MRNTLIKFLKTGLQTLSGAILLSACNGNGLKSDASGSFETEETIISAEASGVLKQFQIEEGQVLKANEMIGYIDSTQLYLKKQQLLAQIQAVLAKRPVVSKQMAAIEEQLRTAEKELNRITNLVKADAAPTKQLDDAQAQVVFLRKQLEAQKSNLHIASDGLTEETKPLQIQIEQIQDQLAKCRIVNPIAGTVLAKYAETYEMTATGKPLYKIANLDQMVLRIYVTGEQLPQLKLNQSLKVLTDKGDGSFHESKGTISWINEKAEFTPKTIQTKNERANLVYAVKVLVKNEGLFKIGMYAEVKF